MSELLLFFHSSLCYFFGGQRVLSQLFVWLRGLVSWRLFIYLFCALHRRCLKSLRLFFEQFALLTFGGSLKSFLLHSIKCRNGSWSKNRDRILTFAPYRIKYFAPQKFASDTRYIVHLHYIYACNSV